MTSLTSTIFDLSAYAVAGATAYFGPPSERPFVTSCLCGIQSFALVSLVDKALKSYFLRGISSDRISLEDVLIAPLLEEAFYSGVLQTEQKRWMIPRFATALILGMSATRALTGRITQEENNKGLAIDTKMALIWALSREALLFTVPSSSALLIVADSCVFALSEVCPKEGYPNLAKFSSRWNYKVLTAAFFRLTANTAAHNAGLAASIAQHILFNLSYAL